MSKSAMQELKEKLQNAIGEYNGVLNEYESGWKQCLITIQNHIDNEFIEKEKEQIMDAYSQGTYNCYICDEDYYNQTYN